jgi:hypothetical protein
LNKKLAAIDKTLEIETLSYALKNQLSFNKMIETQLAQIAATIPTDKTGKIPGQPEAPTENVSMITTRRGNPSRRPSRTNHTERPTH